MVKLDKKKIGELLEFVIIVILFFIGIKKGGYYKQDSLIGVCLIQLIFTIIYFINIKDIRRDNVLSLVLLIFSLAYMLPIFLNATTLSGAINFWSRIYTFFLIFCLVKNSDNKEQYKNGIILTTLVIGICGIDEIGLRLFDVPLKLLGSGYLEDISTKISSVIQYSNLVGILSIVSSLLVAEKISKNSQSNEKKILLTNISLNVLYTFFSIIVFMTQSKMSIVLYIISAIFFILITKKYKGIIKYVLCAIYSFSVALTNSWIVVVISLIVATLYNYCIKNIHISKKENIINIIIALLIILILAINFNTIKNTDNILRFREYFSSFDSTKLRFTYYVDALKLWSKDLKTIVFGMGGNAFRTMYETVQTKEYISLEVHSMFLQILLESGIIGLISILFAIVYSIIKGKDKIAKLILVTLCVFAMFDVYLTYAYMLFVFGIILALCNTENKREVKKIEKISLGVITAMVLLVNIKLSIGYILEPINVDNANNTLEEQEKIIKRCETSLFFDPYDLSYVENYINSCKTYLNIMDIKKELYGEDNIEKRIEIVDKMYKITSKQLEYEKDNKYAIEDAIFVVYKYVDYLVMKNYNVNVLEGYEYYLDYIMKNTVKIKESHRYNKVANEIYLNVISNVYKKFSTVNLLVHSDNIQDVLDTIKEKENISL